MTSYNIFISYRREGGFETAKLIFDCLCRKGYRVFFDMETMRSGRFNVQLYDRIEQCRDFVVIFSPGAFEERPRENDWFRLEIAHALECRKNIIPVFLRGFELPKRETLPEDIADVVDYQGVAASQELFDASLERLCKLLHSRPKVKWWLWGVVACGLILLLAAVLFTISHFERPVVEPPSAPGAVAADPKAAAGTNAPMAGTAPHPKVRAPEAEVAGNAVGKKDAAEKNGKSPDVAAVTPRNDQINFSAEPENLFGGETARRPCQLPETLWRSVCALRRAGQREKAMNLLEVLRQKHADWLPEAAFHSAAALMAGPDELPFENGILVLGYFAQESVRCPLKPGDVIVQIDGKDCNKLSDYNAANTRFVVYRLNRQTKKWRMFKTTRHFTWPKLRLAMLPF